MGLDREQRFHSLYFPNAASPPSFRDNANDSLEGALPEQILEFANVSFNIELRPTDAKRSTCTYTPDDGIEISGPASVCDAFWVYSRLNDAIFENRKLGWKVIDSHMPTVGRMGWCGKGADEILSMPVLDETGQWTHDTYQYFDPYAKDLPRWFRTANDSAFTQYRSRKRYYHSALHPTLHAHIEMAQAAYDALTSKK